MPTRRAIEDEINRLTTVRSNPRSSSGLKEWCGGAIFAMSWVLEEPGAATPHTGTVIYADAECRADAARGIP
jgi:hypothetical protein